MVVGKVLGGGVLEPERVQVICPACGQQVEAVAGDGQVKETKEAYRCMLIHLVTTKKRFM